MSNLRQHRLVRQIPNLLTLARLAAVPVFVLLMVRDRGHSDIAGYLFMAAALTDYFDGFIARRFELMSQFGKIVDPFADRLLIGSATVLLAHYDSLSWYAVPAVLARDGLVVVGFLIVRKVTLPDVNFLGKLATALLLLGLAGTIVAAAPVWKTIFWIGFGCSVVALGQYVAIYGRSIRATGASQR